MQKQHGREIYDYSHTHTRAHLHVVDSDQRKVLGEQRAHRRERVHRAAGRVIVAAEPVLLGRELPPGSGRPTDVHEARE